MNCSAESGGEFGARLPDKGNPLADKIVLLYSDIPGNDEHVTTEGLQKGAAIEVGPGLSGLYSRDHPGFLDRSIAQVFLEQPSPRIRLEKAAAKLKPPETTQPPPVAPPAEPDTKPA